MHGDVALTAAAVDEALLEADLGAGSRTCRIPREALAHRRRELAWRDVPFEDTSTDGRIDPRTLTIAWTTCCRRSASSASTRGTSWAT